MRSKIVVFLTRLRDVFARRRLDADLAEEIETHLALLTDEYVRRGMSEPEARARARAQFGSISAVRDRHWEARGFVHLDAWSRDARIAARMLRRTPGFTAAAVVALGLAIGVSTTVFAVVNATRLRGLPVEEPERIVRIHYPRDDAGRDSGVSFRDFEDFSLASGLEGIAAFRKTSFTLSGDERAAEQFPGLYISSSGFSLLGVPAAEGRYLTAADDRPGAVPVVVLGSQVWRSRYEGDPGVIGRTLRVNGVDATVVGVMPEGFAFDFYADLWQPLAQMPGLDRNRRDARELELVGKLGTGVSVDQARASLQSLANESLVPDVKPFTGTLTGDPMLSFSMLSALFVLVVACANVSGLLFARGFHRQREIAFRVALGATRWQIARQLLIESALLALFAGLSGLALSALGLRGFAAAIEGITRPYWIHFTMDVRVVLYLATVSAFSILLFGLAPALHLAVRKAPAHGGIRRFDFALTVVELGVTLVLMTSAGLMMRSFLAIYEADLAVDTSEMTTMGLTLPAPRYETDEERFQLLERLHRALDSVDVIASSTLSSTVPFANAASRALALEARPLPEDSPPTVAFLTVGPRYFETLGIGLREGRAFTSRDGGPGYTTAIVNDAFVSRYLPGGEPLGERIRLTDPRSGEETPWLTLVGVAPTLRHRRFQPEPTVYLPFRYAPSGSLRLIVRGSSGSADAVVPAVRREVRRLDPELALHAIMTGDELRSQSRWPYRVIGGMLLTFAVIALVIAAVGIYAVTAHAVTKRYQELGIRRALGATDRDLTWLVALPVSTQLASGLVLGGLGTLAAGRLLSSFLVDTSSNDALTFGVVATLLAIAAALSCAIPARRAMRIEPGRALRYE
ncbi:MAG TPA: ADOP family duplicated permease [Vicinamibacteria bacterium]|nr:ADOP family duplicated permease [Vicinamibacteria bacterium]